MRGRTIEDGRVMARLTRRLRAVQRAMLDGGVEAVKPTDAAAKMTILVCGEEKGAVGPWLPAWFGRWAQGRRARRGAS
jgi:hypothetical protein